VERVQQDAISGSFLGVPYCNCTIVWSYHPDVVEGYNLLTHQGEAPLRCVELKILGHSLFAFGVQRGIVKLKLVHHIFFLEVFKTSTRCTHSHEVHFKRTRNEDKHLVPNLCLVMSMHILAKRPKVFTFYLTPLQASKNTHASPLGIIQLIH
jgi:hypothetical protein